MVLRIQAQARENSTTFQTYKQGNELLAEYGLDSVDCPICNNTGVVQYMKDGFMYSKECRCMAARRYNRRIERSGMADMIGRYTFANYQTPDKLRQSIKADAQKFCEADRGWWYISGRPGSGKTHICVAMCNRFAEMGKNIRYMLWRDDSTELKGMLNQPEYKERIEPLKTVQVLYIDDFLKAGKKEGKQKITEADINLAFELLNSRYNNSKLRTIISSELSVKDILEIDEATGSRIWECSFKHRAPEENWRLRG